MRKYKLRQFGIAWWIVNTFKVFLLPLVLWVLYMVLYIIQ